MLQQETILTLLRRQAILDIIVIPEQKAWLRLVTYHYDQDTRCHRFKIDNGAGDDLYAIFSPQGAILKGFAHESCLSPYQDGDTQIANAIYAGMPAALLQQLDEDTEKNDVTFCLWQLPGETVWHQNKVPLPTACLEDVSTADVDGGQSFLLSYIFADAEEWYQWASIYYELQEEAWDAASLLYETDEITRSMVEDINPERDYDIILDECIASGLLPEE